MCYLGDIVCHKCDMARTNINYNNGKSAFGTTELQKRSYTVYNLFQQSLFNGSGTMLPSLLFKKPVNFMIDLGKRKPNANF